MTISAVKSKLTDALSFDDVGGLVRSFETGTLPRAQWTHRAHLIVACWYLICYPEAEAILRIREGIQKYNASQGIVTTNNGGYHETITLFWARIVRRYLMNATLERPLAHIVSDLVTHYSNKDLPFEYYSRDRLMSLPARMNWMEPDLKQVP